MCLCILIRVFEKKAYEFLALIEEKVKPQVVVVGENFRFGFEAQETLSF